MVSDRIKQRLVGAAVLTALAVIFVPVLFNLQPPRPLDQATEIPPAPEVAPVEIQQPIVPEVDNEVPDSGDIFSNAAEEKILEDALPESSTVSDKPVKEKEVPEESVEQMTSLPKDEPKLADSGLPEAWVIQIASYRQQAAAVKQVSRLQEAGYKAFSRQGSAGGMEVYRVFVGPFVSRKSAEGEKKQIDSAIGVDSFILSFEP